MSAANESNGRVEPPEEGASVLSNLPRTRPQRATARRAAARRGGRSEIAHETTMAPAAPRRPARAAKPAKARAKGTAAAKRAPAAPRARPARAAEPVPRQGFESDGDRASGPVSPPGAVELLASAAELLGELAKAGVNTSERLLRDVFSRLPGT